MARASLPIRSALVAAAAALLLAACGDDGGDAAAPDNDADVAVVGQDNLQWDTEQLEAAAGEITVSLTCESGVNHNFVIDETGEEVVACAPGETAEGSVELEAGEYTFVCTVPGHEQRMRGTLTVE